MKQEKRELTWMREKEGALEYDQKQPCDIKTFFDQEV